VGRADLEEACIRGRSFCRGESARGRLKINLQSRDASTSDKHRFRRRRRCKLRLQHQLPESVSQSPRPGYFDPQSQQAQRWLFTNQRSKLEFHPWRGLWRPIPKFCHPMDKMCANARRRQRQFDCLRLHALVQSSTNLQSDRYRSSLDRACLRQLQDRYGQCLLKGRGLWNGIY